MSMYFYYGTYRRTFNCILVNNKDFTLFIYTLNMLSQQFVIISKNSVNCFFKDEKQYWLTILQPKKLSPT